MLKSYAGEKITQIMKSVVEFITAESSVYHRLLLQDLVIVPGNRWRPSLALGSLFKTTCDPQSVVVSFRFGWSPLFCPSSFPPTLGPVVVHLMTREDCQYLLH